MRQAVAWAFFGVADSLLPRAFHTKARSHCPITTLCSRSEWQRKPSVVIPFREGNEVSIWVQHAKLFRAPGLGLQRRARVDYAESHAL